MKSKPSCDPISRDIPDWLTHPFPDNHSNKSISNFSISGLSLKVEIEGPSISQWVKEYLAPLNVEDMEEIDRRWVVKIGENTSFLPKLIRFLRDINLYANRNYPGTYLNNFLASRVWL